MIKTISFIRWIAFFILALPDWAATESVECSVSADNLVFGEYNGFVTHSIRVVCTQYPQSDRTLELGAEERSPTHIHDDSKHRIMSWP